jgi:photosystem II stability/assembly factor-like uncharacterized protein
MKRRLSVRLLALAVLAVLLVSTPTANAYGLWSIVTGPTTTDLYSVFMVSASEGWAVGDGETILHYSNGSWSTVTSPITNLYSVSMVNAGEGWAVGESGTILNYTSGSWSLYTKTSPTTNDLYSVFMLSASEGWAVGDLGTILHYSGGSWSNYTTSPTTNVLDSVSMVSASEGWAVGWGGTILNYTSGSWSLYTKTSPTTNSLYSVSMVSASDGWAVGESGTLLHYSGGSWSNYTTSPTTNSLYSVSMVSASDGWAVGESGTILHYTGGSWTTVTSPTTNLLDSVSMVSASEGWAVGYAQTILHYTVAAGAGALTVNVFVKDSATGRGIEGATIIFDGTTQPGTSNVMGMLTVTGVGPGTHTVTASIANYTDPIVTFYVTRSTTVTVPLTSTVPINTVTVQVYINGTSTPISNAIVYLDGRYAGTTNSTQPSIGQLSLLGVSAGTHTFTVVRSGYITETRIEDLTGSGPWTVEIYLVPR